MKKSLLIYGFIAFLLLLFAHSNSNAQDCICTRTNQDYTLINVYLGDQTGTALPSNYTCSQGQTTTVYLWVVLQGNATRYSLFAHYRLFLDNVQTKVFDANFFNNVAIPTNVPILVDEIQWECGAEVRLANYYMAWQQNNKDIIADCTVTPHGCYAAPGDIIVTAPLIPRMTWDADCTPNSAAETVSYSDNSTGGNYYKVGPKYMWNWNLGPAADYTLVSGTLTSSSVAVKYNTPGVKTAALTVTDSTLVSKTVTETVTVDACLSISIQASPASFECSDATGLNTWLGSHGGAAVQGATGTVTWTWSPYTLTGGCAPYTGSALITFTATDALMNSVATSATLTITDTKAPLITKAAANQTVECDGSGNTTAYNGWLTANAGATASDSCDPALTWSYREGTWSDDCGMTKQITVAFWATDDCGNKSSETSATFTIVDTTAPTVTTPAGNYLHHCDGEEGNAYALNKWLDLNGTAVFSESCGSMTYSHSTVTFTDGCGETGSATVTFWATDACGNKSAGTIGVFTIVDVIKPTFACPQNISKPADTNKTFATVTVPVPAAADGCGLVTLTNSKNGTANASGEYPIGTTTVTYTATDECNNVSTCTFTVTVLDEQAPALTCPANVTGLQCVASAPAAYADYDAFVSAGGTAYDNQGIDTESFRLVSENTNQSTCPLIITRVYEIKDLVGTVASCTQTITILDNTPPQLTVPANNTIECGSDANALSTWLASAMATDNCGTVTPTHNFGTGEGDVNLSDGCGNTGSVTVTWTVADACGNTVTKSATFTLIDTTPPQFTAPDNITIQADQNCEYNVDSEITGWPTNLSDNCAAAPDLIVSFLDNMNEGSTAGVYVITRTWKVKDLCGNTTTKSQVITVTGGKQPPTLVLNETCVYLTKYGKWTLNATEIKKITAGSHTNCNVEGTLKFTFSDINFDCVDAVNTKKLVFVTAMDSQGNTATGSVWILVADTISPVAVCKDATIYLDKFGQAYLGKEMINKGFNGVAPEWAKFFNKGNDGSYDNCGIQDIFLSRQLYTCADLNGPKEVIMSAVDPSGNTSVCKSMVTVLDTIKPVIAPVANVVITVAPGVCTTKVDYPVLNVTDNCGVYLDKLAGLGPNGMFPAGTTTVETWKASNMGGTFSQVSFTVTVNTYNGAPVIAPVSNVTLAEDAAIYEVMLSGIGYGPDCAPQQILSLDVVNSNTALIKVEKVYVNGEATGKLKITPLKDMSGEATVTLTIKDNGGIANGGIDTSVFTFKVTVTPVNDVPTVTPIADQVVIIPNSLSVNVVTPFKDVDNGDVLTFRVTKADGTALPTWMTFNATTGLLTGTPTLSNYGAVDIKVVATDKAGATVEDIFNVLVKGEFKIMGKVVRKTGTPVLITQGLDPVATPAAGVEMVLKQGGIVVVSTLTAADGTYSFSVPAGDYGVFVIVTGYTQNVTQNVTVNSANPIKDKVDFTLWSGSSVITNFKELSGDFGIKLYPNPTTGKVNIDVTWKDIREVEVMVFTMQGARVFQKKFFNGEDIVFDLSSHSIGMYMVKINTGSVDRMEKLVIDRR